MKQAPVSLMVYPGDCDAFGHLNQAACVACFERARWQALAEGPGMDLFTREQVWPAVRRAVAEYHAPAFPGQSLQFHQVVTRIGRTSFSMRQTARRDADDILIATLETVFVCINRSGAAVPIPAAVAAELRPVMPDPPAAQRRIAVHGVELALDDQGGGPALLFVHGFPLNGTSWRHQAGAIPGWRTLVPDLRGLGHSDAPDLGYSMATYADDLAGMLDALGVEDVVLVGLSMGGYIAFEFLRRHRPRVRALVLADSRSQADSTEGRKARDVAMADLREGGAPLLAAQMLPRLVGAGSPESLREEVRLMIAGSPVPGLLGALAAMRDRPDSTPLLPTLAGLPTLIVVGAEDVLTPPRDSEAMAKAIPGARLAIIPEAGHLSPLEQPEAFNRHLGLFLERLPPRP